MLSRNQAALCSFFFLSLLLLILVCVKFVSEILILGCGRYIEPVNPELRQFIRSTGMKLEAIDSVFSLLII